MVVPDAEALLQIGGLDRGAVGHRISEGHAELDHVGAAFHERVEDRGGGGRRGIAGGDEGDERGAMLCSCAIEGG